MDAVGHLLPALHARLGRRLDAEGRQHFAVQAFLVIGDRHIVDVADIQRLDDGRFAHVAKQRQLAPLLLGNGPVGAHQKDVRRDADRAQFLDRMLGRLGFQFPAEGM